MKLVGWPFNFYELDFFPTYLVKPVAGKVRKLTTISWLASFMMLKNSQILEAQGGVNES